MYEANRSWIVLAYPAQSAIDKGPEADYFGFLTPAQLGATTTMSDEIASTHEVAKVAARFGREVRELILMPKRLSSTAASARLRSNMYPRAQEATSFLRRSRLW